MSIHFKRLTGRKSNILRDDFEGPLIIELKNGKTYAGVLDEFMPEEGGIISLYSCKLLDKKHHRWVDHDITMMKFDGKILRDPMPDFRLRDIKNIFVLSDSLKNRFYTEDILQLYIDPHHNPLPKVECDWNPPLKRLKHNPECDARLHEALSFLLTEMEVVSSRVSSEHRDDASSEKFGKSFEYVRRRLVMFGARIP